MAARHSQRMVMGAALAGLALLALLAGCASAPASDADRAKLQRTQHIVVIYAENHSFNNLFAAMSQVGGWSMGHYDGSQFLLWQWARDTHWPTTSSRARLAARS